MDSKQQNNNLFSQKTESPMDAYFESPAPLTKKTMTTLTLFDDLLQNSESKNSNSDTSLPDQYQPDSYPSDCESGISGMDDGQNQLGVDNGMVRLHEGDKLFEIIRNKFLSNFISHGFTAQVQNISRNDYSGIMNEVKYRSFCLYSKGMEIKRKGNANVKYAWYGTSKEELNTILSYGFSFSTNTGIYGSGLYLSPIDQPIESMQSAAADENGVRHMLLCRVILGNTEVIHPGSAQYKPSCEELDSGIDNSASPKKYIIWNANINTHILPEFMVSFRASSYSRGCRKVPQPARVPKSDWMPFATLIQNISKFLPPCEVKLIANNHCEYRKQKITRDEMIRRVRCIAGDKLLMRIIKSYKEKVKASWRSS